MIESVTGGTFGIGLGVVPLLVNRPSPIYIFLSLLPHVATVLIVGVGLGLLITLLSGKRLRRAWLWLPLGLLLIGAIGFGIWLASRPVEYEPPVAVFEGGTDWSAFRGGPRRLGAVSGAEDATKSARVWSYEKPKCYYASPAVVGNRVYITSADRGVFSDNGSIFCLDADTGGPVWQSTPADYRATFSSPAVAGDYLVVGEGLHFTENARVFCLDPVTGGKLWSFSTCSHVESSPCIDLKNKRVYIGAGDDGYYCFALDPDENGNAKVLWHLKGKKSTDPKALTSDKGQIYADAETSPIVHDDKVYFGLGLAKGDDDAQAIVCVDAKTGKEYWRLETPYPVFGSPSICDNKLFVGMGWGDFINKAEVLGKRPAGEVWCVDISGEKPAVLWRFQAKRTVLGAVAATKDLVYFGDRAGFFYCVSVKDGTLAAKWNAGQPITTSPAVGKKHVYFVTDAGRLHCLTIPKLKPVWNLLLGTQGIFISSPALGRGHVYIGTSDKGLLCLGAPGEPEKIVWAGRLGGPGRGGVAGQGVVPTTARYAWRFPGSKNARGESNPRRFDTPRVNAPIAVIRNSIYVGCMSDGKAGLSRIVLDGRKRKVAWEQASKNPVHVSPVATEKRVCFVDGKPGDEGRMVRCVDAESGSLLWEHPVDKNARGELQIIAGRLLVFDRSDALGCIALEGDRAGEVLWRRKAVGPRAGVAPVDRERFVLTQEQPAGLVVASLADGTGNLIPLARPAIVGPVYADGKVYYADAVGVKAMDLSNRKLGWTLDCGPVAGSLVLGEHWLLAVSSEGEALLLNVKNGHLARGLKITGLSTDPRFTPMLLSEGEGERDLTLVFCSADRQTIQAFRIRADIDAEYRPTGTYSAESRVLVGTKKGIRTGPLVSSPVLRESHLYYGTERKGLVCAKPR